MGILTFEPFEYVNVSHFNALSAMFADYFDEIVWNNPQDKVPKHVIPKLLKIIADETSKYQEWLYICEKDDEFIGFSEFQIDTSDNPLCKRKDWGFIREFYIIPLQRRNGYAKQMCKFVENMLFEKKPCGIYLTTDPKAIPFWTAMGYICSGKKDGKNGKEIYEKRREA